MSGFKVLRSLKSSTDGPVRTKLQGELPKWLSGTLFRNGPGRFEFNGKSYTHLFDGQACVHKFKIQNGEVFYSNKLLETQSYKQTIKQDRLFPNFGTTDTKSTILERFNHRFIKAPEWSDNVNVNVVPYANEQLYALTESSKYCRLDPNDLKILNTASVDTYVPKVRSIIAHPHIDRDGTWINMGLNDKGQYQFIRYKGGEKAAKSENAGENAEKIATIDSTHKLGFSYFHSFGVTKNHIIFLEQALKLSYKHFLTSVITNKPMSDALIMERDFPTKIYLINKQTGEVSKQKFYTDPQFTFHFINCFEQDDNINIDLSSYDAKFFDINSFTYENMNQGNLKETKQFKAIPKRITVPFKKSNSSNDGIYCDIKVLNQDTPFEAPVINYWKNNGLPYKYAYGINHYQDPVCVTKLNVENLKEVKKMEYPIDKDGSTFLPSEPIFVEHPNPTSEDDGVLLVMVLSENKNDFLSVLDAKTLKQIARADIPDGIRGAMTFHGFFADDIHFKKLNE